MYSPDVFQIHDAGLLAAFMAQHSFATLVSSDGNSLQATHIPVILQQGRGIHGTLISHLARANPQWQHFQEGREVLTIFQGPHAYISPAWYVTSPAVPTWNYTAVHAYGVPRVVEDHERLAQMLSDLIEANESGRKGRWSGELPVEFRDRLMKGIVGFEMEITRIEGKFKLSQNRPQDVPGIIAALECSESSMDRDVATLMRHQQGK